MYYEKCYIKTSDSGKETWLYCVVLKSCTVAAPANGMFPFDSRRHTYVPYRIHIQPVEAFTNTVVLSAGAKCFC